MQITLLTGANPKNRMVLINVPNRRVNKEDKRLRARFPGAHLSGNIVGRKAVQENSFLVGPEGTDFEKIITTMGWGLHE